MKRSLKVLAMLVVATMLLSMAAFAAEVTPGTISHEEVGTDYTITVNFDASSYEDGDQVTMLVLTGSNEIEFDEDGVTPTNVGYIDQDEIEGATGSFTFSVAKDFVLNNEVYVKLGATAKTTAAEDTYTFEEGGEDPIDPPTPPADEDDVVLEDTVNATIASVTSTTMGENVGAIYTVALTDAELEGLVPVAYAGDEVVGTVLYSTERAKYIVVVPADAGDITLKAVAAEDALVTNFVYGDVVGNDSVMNSNDVQTITVRLKGIADNVNTVAKMIAADVDGNGIINSNDVQAMKVSLKGIADLGILTR